MIISGWGLKRDRTTEGDWGESGTLAGYGAMRVSSTPPAATFGDGAATSGQWMGTAGYTWIAEVIVGDFTPTFDIEMIPFLNFN